MVQRLPDLKPSFQQFDRDFFPDFGAVSAFNLGSKEANGDKNEKCLIRQKDSRLQTKLCNAWGAQSWRNLKNDNGKVKNENRKKWNNWEDRHLNSQFLQPTDQIQDMKNFMVNSASIINLRENQIKSAKEMLDQIMEVESFENLNESMKTLLYLTRDTVETAQEQSLTHMFLFDDLFFKEKQRENLWNRSSKKRNIYSCPDSSSYYNRTVHNNADVNCESILFTELDEKHQKDCQFIEKVISCRQIRRDMKARNKQGFLFDFISSEKESGVKIMVELKKNKSIIHYNSMEERLKNVNLKMFQVGTRKSENSKNTFFRYVFKMSLEINKKKVVLKCTVSCFDKEKREYNRLNCKSKQQLRSNTNCCRIQSKHGSLNGKVYKKRHSLYTNTSLISADQKKSKHCDNTYHSVHLAEGDLPLTGLNDKQEYSMLQDDTRKHLANFEEQDNLMDVAILKQCLELTKDCFTDGTELFCADVPQLTYGKTEENEILATIEEETTGDGDECLEKIKTNFCPIRTLEKNYQHLENDQNHKEPILGRKDKEQRFDKNKLVQLPLLCKKSNLYDDKSKIQREIQTTLNLKASQILEKINSTRLKENNSLARNISKAPRSLTCIFELRSFDETMYMQNILLNRFYDEMLDKEEFSLVQNTILNRQSFSKNCGTSCTSLDDEDQNKSQVVEYKEPQLDLERITLEKEEAVLEKSTPINSLFVAETIFINNESDDLFLDSQNTSSDVVLMEGAMFSSSDNNSTTTLIWNETDFSDDEHSIESQSS